MHTNRLTLILLIAIGLAGCASSPKLSQEQILSQHKQIASLQAGLNEASAQGADYLAPEGYQAVRTHLDKAMSEAADGDTATANAAAKQGLSALAQLNENTATSRKLLGEALAVRTRAYQAGAQKLYKSDTADLDSDLRRTTKLIEQGEFEEAKQRRPKLIAGYEQLELAALKQNTGTVARKAIEDAKRYGAMKYAPKTLMMAEKEVDLALSVLEADRTKTDKANFHSDRAQWLAARSGAITELIRDFERRDYTQEDIVLWYQKQLSEINRPISQELPFNLSNDTVVKGMQQSVSQLIKQRDETAVTSSQYKQELSLTSEQRRAVEKVQSLFTATEANVYQQRRNVLISAHGFHFPSGGSKLETENFTLINKIIKAIETFPGSQIKVSGHTDAVGAAATNKRLSELRAGNIAKFLTEVGGISPNRMEVAGYGETRPVASNETREGRAANRRVEILIVNK